ncbi:MAG: methyltransferase domain-containing protein [Myxococcota bacterium]
MSRRGKGYVDARYLTEVSRSTAGLKELTYRWMGAREGAVLLDAGCGPGEDTLALAQRVGPSGRVVGVDADEGLLRVARRRARAAGFSHVSHRKAVLPRLPFRDGTFDGVRSERVFQHLTRPLESLREVVRVTKVGGRVVLMEPDWGTLVVDAGDAALERAVLSAGAEHALNNGYAGRRLLGDFVRVGLTQVEVELIPIRYPSLAAADHYILFGFEEAARRRVGARAMGRWRRALEAAEAEGRFFAAFQYVLAAGVVG